MGAAHTLTPDARSVRNTRALIRTFLDLLRSHKVIDRVEVTKYRSVHRGRVLLCTVIKHLTRNECRAHI